MINKRIEKLLANVQKPGRYVGGELNCVMISAQSVLFTIMLLWLVKLLFAAHGDGSIMRKRTKM